jgi:hypothetical protein
MARIAKSEYPKIQQMVQAEGRKVPEVATMYGCSPANIYAILSKLRRHEGAVAPAQSGLASTSAHDGPTEMPSVAGDRPAAVAHGGMAGDLLAAIEGANAAPAPQEAGAAPSEEPAEAPLLVQPEQVAPILAVPSPVAEEPRITMPSPGPSAARQPAPGGAARKPAAALSLVETKPARAAKTGYALCMRSSDGDEASTPFRSLDELLSAVKPMLRNVARSPDPVWFSIRQINLADIDTEAA